MIPKVIVSQTFQTAWISAVNFLSTQKWEYCNLVVQVTDTNAFDEQVNERICLFATENQVLQPKHVAYTIFPFGQYYGKGSAEQLYHNYINRFYPWTRKRPRKGWGTYFYRMINYESKGRIINQLRNIINSINSRQKTYKACCTLGLIYPGSETIRVMGAPCLNYIAVQLQPGTPGSVNFLCVYRNHDFLERAYGNYWGLCELLQFISSETDLVPGNLTCISSHAYIPKYKRELKSFLGTLR